MRSLTHLHTPAADAAMLAAIDQPRAYIPPTYLLAELAARGSAEAWLASDTSLECELPKCAGVCAGYGPEYTPAMDHCLVCWERYDIEAAREFRAWLMSVAPCPTPCPCGACDVVDDLCPDGYAAIAYDDLGF